jgi:hypothetical protein
MSDEIVLQRTAATPKASTFPTEIIDLPSKGHFYPAGSPLSSGRIELKLMTAKEEDILISPNLLKKGLAIDKLLESLIIDKNIKIGDLLLGDKNALIFAVRRLAYGDTYGPVEIQCPKCAAKSKETIDLSQLKEKEFDETQYEPGTNVFEFVLPTSKATVQFKLLTDADEKIIEKDNVALGKLNKVSSGEITTRLKRQIVSVNGETDPVKVKGFVDNMPSRDSLALRQHIRSITPDIDANFNFTCADCGQEEKVGVPMTVQFFWPDAGV